MDKESLLISEAYASIARITDETSNLDSDKDTCVSHLQTALKTLRIIKDMDNPQVELDHVISTIEQIIDEVSNIN